MDSFLKFDFLEGLFSTPTRPRAQGQKGWPKVIKLMFAIDLIAVVAILAAGLVRKLW
jgi:hypothetical protein